MFETIVVGIDDSEFSRAALLEVSHWVKNHGGKVILVNAAYFDEEEYGIAPEQSERRIAVGKKICIQRKELLASEFGMNGNVESLVCEGDPPKVIVDVAEEKKADLIALGTHGRKGLKRLLLGSVTSGVIVNAPCDVLVAKKPCVSCTGQYRSVLVPFDASEFSKKALERACRLVATSKAEITALYVIPRYEEMIDFLKTDSIRNSLYREAEKIVKQAKDLASVFGVNIEVSVDEGQAYEKIIEQARRMGHDLIVIGSYGYKGVNKAIMGSTAERVIMNSSSPVLVVR